MADTQPLVPTDAEIHALWRECDQPTDENGHITGPLPFARAVLAKWGAQPVVPAGYALVPVEPVTEDMHIAAVKVLQRASGLDGLPQRMLAAMIAAAPQPDHSEHPLEMAAPTRSGEPVGYTHASWIADAKRGGGGHFSGRQTPGFDVPLYIAPQPVVREPLTDEQIREWWASENGLEDCEMCKLEDFLLVVRAVEEKHGITGGQHGAE